MMLMAGVSFSTEFIFRHANETPIARASILVAIAKVKTTLGLDGS